MKPTKHYYQQGFSNLNDLIADIEASHDLYKEKERVNRLQARQNRTFINQIKQAKGE